MSYMSDATGTLAMMTNNCKVLEELKKCFETTRFWWYDISCIDLENKEVHEFFGPLDQDVGLQYHIVCSFKGHGECSFHSTIEKFQNWLEKEIIPKSQLLKDSDFRIAFNYCDQNSRLNFINEQNDILVHASNETVVEGQCLYKSTHNYTFVNKAKYTGISLNQVISNEFKYIDSPFIISILNKQREEIEQYTGKLLEIYLYENNLGKYAELIA